MPKGKPAVNRKSKASKQTLKTTEEDDILESYSETDKTGINYFFGNSTGCRSIPNAKADYLWVSIPLTLRVRDIRPRQMKKVIKSMFGMVKNHIKQLRKEKEGW